MAQQRSIRVETIHACAREWRPAILQNPCRRPYVYMMHVARRTYPTIEMFMSNAEQSAKASPAPMVPVISAPCAASALIDSTLMVVPIMVCGLEN